MTVLVGLIHPTDGVAIVADRASVDLSIDIGGGVPGYAEPRLKVRSNGRGLVAGVTGLAERNDVSVLQLVDDALTRSEDLQEAATRIWRLLKDAAPTLLSGVETSEAGQKLAVVVLVGGYDGRVPALHAVVLRENGTTGMQTPERSVALTPPSVQVQADAVLAESLTAGHDLSEQLAVWSELMPQLASTTIPGDGVDVSSDHDYALAGRPGHSVAVAVDPSPTGLSIPRH